MRLLYCSLVILWLALGSLDAQEDTTFLAPIQPDPGATQFRISRIIIDIKASDIQFRLEETGLVRAMLDDGTPLENPNGSPMMITGFIDGGKVKTIQYAGHDGQNLIRELNTTAHSPGKSLQSWLLQRAQADGKMPAAAVSGSPRAPGPPPEAGTPGGPPAGP